MQPSPVWPIHYECPECGWDEVLLSSGTGISRVCRICLEDCSHFIVMISRAATTEDKPEGLDERAKR